MTTPQHDSDGLDKVLALPMAEYIGISNIVFTDFHGQEKGEDKQFDSYFDRQQKAYRKLKSALTRHIKREVIRGKIEILDKLDYNKQMFGDWQQVIENERAQLEAELEGIG